MNNWRILVGTAAAIIVAVLVTAAAWDGPTAGIDRYAVRDGDTLELTPRDCFLSRVGLSCLAQRLRLFGVDAFESGQMCRDPAGKAWPCGLVATRRLAALAARPGFACNVDNEFIDRHAREFAVCTANGQDVGGVLVSEGLAFAYGRRTRYVVIEEQAKAAHRGAWAGSFVRPQFFRSGARD